MSRSILVLSVLVYLASALPAPRIEETTDENGVSWVGPIRKCPVGDDASYNECLQQVVDDLTPKVAAGIAELGLRPLDPLFLEKFNFEQKMGPIEIKVDSTNIQLYNLVKYKTMKFTVDTQKRIMSFEYEVPNIRINSDYKLSGNVFFFPLTGSGPATTEILNTHVEGHMNFKKVFKGDGSQVMQLQDTVMDKMTVGGLRVRIRGLFDGNPLFSGVVHYVANQYGSEVFEVIKPQIAQFTGDIITNKILNPILDKLPHLADYVPDDE